MSDLRRPLARTLMVFGVGGLLFALTSLPTLFSLVTGNGRLGPYNEFFLPAALQWSVLSFSGIGLILVGGLAALLAVVGHWPARIVSAVAVVWFVYSKAAFTGKGYWGSRMALSGDGTPYSVAVAISVVLLGALCVFALLIARDLRGRAESPQARQSVSSREGAS